MARLLMLEFLEYELFSSRNTILIQSHHVRTYIDTKIYTKVRKPRLADVSDTWCERSLGQGETIDTIATAQFALDQEILRTYDPHTNLRYYDERHQNCFAQRSFTNFDLKV